MRASFALILAAAAILIGSPASANTIVSVSPADTEVQLGDTFDVFVIADFSNAVAGWGLDVDASDDTLLSVVNVQIADPWVSANAADGDQLVGLAYPDLVQGDAVLLATITYSADHIGMTTLTPGTTVGDFTEGFPLFPTGFDDAEYQPGTVNIVPEPATYAMLVFAGVAWLRRRIGRQ